MDRRVLALALVGLAACRGSGGKPGAAPAHDAGTVARSASKATIADDGGPIDVDAAPLRAGDVLEGSAAEAAMAEALAKGGAPEDPDATGLRLDGVAGFRLGLGRADVIKRLGLAAPLIRQPRPSPDAPIVEEALARTTSGLPWLRVRLLAGRVVELEVLARDGRALTDEGIGVGSTFEEAVLAHGDARAVVDEKTGRVRGWVLADLPGLLWVATGPPLLGKADTPPPEGARVARVLVLGPEALAPPD
jgi:hypothetical protein